MIQRGALGLILFIAALLRFSHLSHQGFMVFDDATYVVAAKFGAQEFARMAERFDMPPGLVEARQSYYRPGFIGLVRLSSHFVGWSPLTGAVVSAVLGVLTVGVVYGMTRQLFTRRAALIATALFATSTWHIFHSRVGLSNATAVFFFTAGLYYWLQFAANRRRSVVTPLIAGVLFGYAFTAHYGLLLYLSVGLLLELWLAVRERTYRGTLMLIVGAVIPFYGFYGQYGWVALVEILRLAQGTQSSPDPLYYLRLFWRYETLPLTVFSVVGAIRAVQTFRQRPLDREASLYVLCFASLLLLSLQAAGGNARPRLMAPLFPLFAVLSGGAATLLMDSAFVRRGGTTLWGATLGLILVAGLVVNRGFFAWHSGFEAAVDYLHTRYPTSRYACYSWWPVCDFYHLGPLVAPNAPHAQRLAQLSPRAEFLFAQAIAIDQNWDRGVFGVLPGKPVAQFENLIEHDPRVGEETGSGVDYLGLIRIYDLRPVRRAAPGDTRAVVPPVTVPPDPNVRDALGTTPLMRVAAAGHAVTLKALLAKGADVNATPPSGVTALMAAAATGHTVVAALLLAAGADLNARTQNGMTALMAAAATGHTGTAAVLLAAGADLQATRQDGATALLLAALSGHPETAAFLMQAGRTRQTGGVPLLLALQHLNIPLSDDAFIERATQGDMQAVELLLAFLMNQNTQDTSRTMALMMAAAATGHTTIVDALLAVGADVNMKASSGETALMAAAREGHTAIVATLLAQGADVNARRMDLDGWSGGTTALMLAAANGHLATVQALLAGGADVDANTLRGATALMGAAIDGDLHVVQALLAAGADVNARQSNGWTALMGAAEQGHTAIVQALLGRGVAVQAKYKNSTTALMLATEQGHSTIVELLKMAGAQRSD